MEAIEEVHVVYGVQDPIIKIEFEDGEALTSLAVDQTKSPKCVLGIQTDACFTSS